MGAGDIGIAVIGNRHQPIRLFEDHVKQKSDTATNDKRRPLHHRSW
jgi:hypothetical protein